MTRRAALFTKADLRRAASVAKEKGFAFEMTPSGTVRFTPYEAPEPANSNFYPQAQTSPSKPIPDFVL